MKSNHLGEFMTFSLKIFGLLEALSTFWITKEEFMSTLCFKKVLFHNVDSYLLSHLEEISCLQCIKVHFSSISMTLTAAKWYNLVMTLKMGSIIWCDTSKAMTMFANC